MKTSNECEQSDIKQRRTKEGCEEGKRAPPTKRNLPGSERTETRTPEYTRTHAHTHTRTPIHIHRESLDGTRWMESLRIPTPNLLPGVGVPLQRWYRGGGGHEDSRGGSPRRSRIDGDRASKGGVGSDFVECIDPDCRRGDEILSLRDSSRLLSCPFPSTLRFFCSLRDRFVWILSCFFVLFFFFFFLWLVGWCLGRHIRFLSGECAWVSSCEAVGTGIRRSRT